MPVKKIYRDNIFGLLLCFLCNFLVTAIAAQQPALLELSANPPEGTTSVRFFVDDMQVAELTDLYAKKTNNRPVWKTVIDPVWLDRGEHLVRIEATTSGGIQTIGTQKVRGTKEDKPGLLSLTGAWSFASANELPAGVLEGNQPSVAKPGYKKGSWTKILVPNSLGAVSSKWNVYEGLIGAYRKNFTVNPRKNEQMAIVLESCYWSGKVFVNGKEAGSTHGGYLPSRFDITKLVRRGKNEIVIIVDNRFSTMGVFKRLNEFYWNWGGLLQEVYIEKRPVVALADLRAEGTMSGKLHLHVTCLNKTTQAVQKIITVEVNDATGKRIYGPQEKSLMIPAGNSIIALEEMQLTDPVLWELEAPYLYTVTVKGDFGTLTERTGFRDVAVKGMDILLNGKVIQDLQGFDRHADYPGLGRTQPAGLVYQELKILHDKGFRFFRPAHYPTTPAMLTAADEIGLLVIEEINVTGLKGAVLATDEVRAFGAQQLAKMIERDRSHPSIMAWSVGNENLTEEEGAAQYISETIAAGKALDSKRLYTHVTMRHTLDKTYAYQDFVAQNYYAGWYAKDINSIVTLFDAIQAYAGNKPVLLSEYGAEAIPGKPGFSKGTEFYQGFVVDAHNRLLNNRKHFFGKMYWCSTDFWCRPNWTGGNPEPSPPFHYKSLISLDRQHKKLGWKVMFSPVRIILNPHTTRANDLGGEIFIPIGKDTVIHQVITLKDIKGKGAKGKMQIELPPGFTADVTSLPFVLQPDEGKAVNIAIKGRLTSADTSVNCIIKAIIDEDTEAQPILLTIKPVEQRK